MNENLKNTLKKEIVSKYILQRNENEMKGQTFILKNYLNTK